MINSSLQNVGVLDGGSITSNFGSINVGDSPIETSGTGTFGNLIVDNVKIDGDRIGFKENVDYILFKDSNVRFETNINLSYDKFFN